MASLNFGLIVQTAIKNHFGEALFFPYAFAIICGTLLKLGVVSLETATAILITFL